jgi:uncharacterized protein (DUF433 family)
VDGADTPTHIPIAGGDEVNWRDHIAVNPNVCHGTACFNGTRIVVSIVLDNLAAGRSKTEIQEDYPTLPAQAIEAALAYAAELARERVIHLPGSDAA